MMGNFFNQLKLNGTVFTKEELKNRAKQFIHKDFVPDYEHDFWTFINEWFNSSETICIHTSGSTGTPKSILVRKEYMVHSAQKTCDFFGFKAEWNILLCLPVHYIAGKMMIVRAMLSGCNLIFREPSGNPLSNLSDQIDFAAFVPLQLHNMLQNKEETEKLEQIGGMIIGGAAIPMKTALKTINFPNKIFATYGMTETVSHIALRLVNGPDRSDFFSPLQGVEVSLNEKGCLIIHSPEIGADYLTTTDLAEIRGDQSFRILGRLDNVINSGGIKLFPEQIESKIESIMDCPFIYCSVPDIKFGEKTVLIIEGEQKDKEHISSLFQRLNTILGKYEIPRQIIFVTELPKTSTGKIDRKKARTMTLK